MLNGLEAVFFYLFAFVAVAAAFMVISARNPVHSVLYLILTFVNAAGRFLLTGAEFLAMILLVGYVGAVAVLFLFVVMMLDVDFAPVREGFVRFLPVGIVVAVVMLVEMLMMIGVRTLQMAPIDDPAAQAGMSNMGWLGRTLFRDFLLPFEVAALILTVGLIAAIPLTLRKRSGIKTQNPGRQVMVKREDRIRLVKMSAEKKGEVAP
jgi:NADH-quinone oxidoreductase subunit J